MLSEITLRPATLDDVEQVYGWRNAEETRRYSFNPHPISMHEHKRWFEESLSLGDRHLLIAEQNQLPIGVLRFDTSQLNPTRAEVNIYLCPGLSGKGLGTQLLATGMQWVKQHLPAVETVMARVVPENIVSCRLFEKSGFQKTAFLFEKKL